MVNLNCKINLLSGDRNLVGEDLITFSEARVSDTSINTFEILCSINKKWSWSYLDLYLSLRDKRIGLVRDKVAPKAPRVLIKKCFIHHSC